MTSENREQRIHRLAERQLADYDRRQPGTMFADEISLDVGEAYEIQLAVASLRRQRGESIVGYKVGCTSPTIRARLGIDHCISGRLFATERFPSGTTLARSDFASLAIEGELAVLLDREPTLEDFRHDMPSCVKQVFPVIELHHHVTRTPHPSAAELIANNAIHAGFVEGPGGDPQLTSADSSLSIHMDGRQIDACQGPELIRTIHTSLRWLTDHLHERGERLEEDQIVLSGSITDLIPVGDNCRVVVGAPPFGVVEARFT